jgi:hypothetical protein
LLFFKCDQIEPACSQCLRAQKECPGYRDQLALAFRDENAKVIQKAHIPKPRKEQHRVKRVNQKAKGNFDTFDTVDTYCLSEKSSKSPSPDSLIRRNNSPTYSLSTPLFDDQGIHFFFAHYVTILYNPGTMKSIGNGTSPLWEALFKSPLFTNTVSSVGFAGLSNVTNNKNHMIVARKKYAVTLREIKQALADITKGDLDGTFKAVLLLAAYEVSVGCKTTLFNPNLASSVNQRQFRGFRRLGHSR